MRVHALGCFCSCWHPGPRLSEVEGLGLIGVGAVGFKVLGAQPAGVAGSSVSVEASPLRFAGLLLRCTAV